MKLIFVTSYFQTISLEKGNKWFVLLTVQFQGSDVFFFFSDLKSNENVNYI